MGPFVEGCRHGLISRHPIKQRHAAHRPAQTLHRRGIRRGQLLANNIPAQGQSLYLAALRNEYLITDQFNERINAVTVSEVNEVLKKYLTKVYWTYLGKNTEQFSSAIKERVTTVGLD